MKLFGFILIGISILLFVLILIARAKKWKIDISLISYLMLVTSLFGAFIAGVYTGEKTASIQALNNNNAYEMEIRYELKDSIYVPIDTLYIEIGKN